MKIYNIENFPVGLQSGACGSRCTTSKSCWLLGVVLVGSNYQEMCQIYMRTACTCMLAYREVFFFCCTSGSDGCYSPESCVFDDVFADYNTRVRPASTPGEVIHINVTITVTSLIGIVNSVYAFLGNCTSRFKRHNTFGMSKNIWAYLRKNLASSPTRIPAWIKPCDVSLGFTWFSRDFQDERNEVMTLGGYLTLVSFSRSKITQLYTRSMQIIETCAAPVLIV